MKPLHLQFLPTLAGFGPLFIVIGLVFTNQTGTNASVFQSTLRFTFAIGGALMTSSALLILVREVACFRQMLETRPNDV